MSKTAITHMSQSDDANLLLVTNLALKNPTCDALYERSWDLCTAGMDYIETVERNKGGTGKLPIHHRALVLVLFVRTLRTAPTLYSTRAPFSPVTTSQQEKPLILPAGICCVTISTCSSNSNHIVINPPTYSGTQALGYSDLTIPGSQTLNSDSIHANPQQVPAAKRERNESAIYVRMQPENEIDSANGREGKKGRAATVGI
ncbi:hypothetical protein BJ912DRAFT_1040246 [Pholiota molesta]|nr:hypothetical protein BJ912DRAFT_1040246 [Pholiota molesta]